LFSLKKFLSRRARDGDEGNSETLDSSDVFRVQGSLEVLDGILILASEEVALGLGDDHERSSNLEVSSPHNFFPLDNISHGGVLLEDDLQVVKFTLGIRELEILDVSLVGFNEFLEFRFLHKFEESGFSVTFHGESIDPNLEQFRKSNLSDDTSSIISVRFKTVETGLGLNITHFRGTVSLEHLESGTERADTIGQFSDAAENTFRIGKSKDGKKNKDSLVHV